MLTIILITYTTIALIWSCYAVYMFFGSKYHKNKSIAFIVAHVALTFIVNLLIFPIAVFVAYKRKILTPKQWQKNIK